MTEPTHSILIVEDDPAIREVLRALLTIEGFEIIEAETGAGAQIAARDRRPALLLIDLGLPDIDGLTVIRAVRTWSAAPIIVVSARNTEDQKIAALDAGADDYVVKPFSAPELLARVRAGLRRNTRTDEQQPTLYCGAIQIDLQRRQARGAAGDIHFTPLEYRVLECLARHTGMVMLHRQLLREVWGPHREYDERSLRICIKGLRDKLEVDPGRPHYLITEVGIGYRLRVDGASS